MNLPIELNSTIRNVDEAFALDWYKNDDGYTELGNYVYTFKYKNDSNEPNKEKLKQFINLIHSELKDISFDIIIPVPSYNPRTKENENGDFKLMYNVVEGLADTMKKPYSFEFVTKNTEKQAKDSILQEDNFKSINISLKNCTVLVLDDLFQSGDSANFTITALKKLNPDVNFKFCSITKNKFGGIGKRKIVEIFFKPGYNIAKNEKKYLTLFTEDRNSINIFEGSPGFDEISKSFDNHEYKQQFEVIVKESNGYYNVVDYIRRIEEDDD